MAASNQRRRKPRRRRRRRSTQQRPNNQTFAETQLPPRPENEWVQKDIKSFATKRKKAEFQLSTFIKLDLPDLQDLAEKANVEDALGLQRGELLRRLIRAQFAEGQVFFTEGVLEVTTDGHGFLRHNANDYTPNFDTDALLHKQLIEKYHLQAGQIVAGVLAPLPEEEGREDMLVLHEVLTVFGEDPEKQFSNVPFHDLTALYPEERLRLETDKETTETRIIDLVSPVGKGQRGLIVAPPRTGKTVLLQMIANAICTNYPECHLMILLVDERPEEVTDFERSVVGENREIAASTFDEPPERHIQVAERVIEQAKSRVEQGEDVVVLLDSITRLARAYNNCASSNSKIMSGGLVSDALLKPKRFFGAARNIEEGGSLTIIATALVDTGSKMDEVIYEEFKGTGNQELHLDRKVAEKRIYPAINVRRSGTRREDLLMSESDLQRLWILRRLLAEMEDVPAIEFLLDKLRQSETNNEFFDSMRGGKAAKKK
jgi:transcription termination factor Rho